MPPAEHERIAATIVNYGTAADTLLAVASLLSSSRRPDEIIVIDNDASDACREVLQGVWSTITYLQTGRNLGFSGGVNQGIRVALERGADAVLLLNSDATVSPDCLQKLTGALDSGTSVGIVGPVVLMQGSPGRIATAGISYRASTGRMRNLKCGASDAPSSGYEVVDAVSGCGMLIKRSVFDAVGLFDEDYFFSFEDVDFCLRARRAGFQTVVAADARMFHEGSRSIGAASPLRLYFGARNHLRVATRVEPVPGALLGMFRTATIGSLSFAHAVISPGGSLRSRLGAVARGIRDHLAGRYGAAS